MVSVIVLNYNGAKYLSTLLSSLHRQSSNSFELIVVDNGSTDNSIVLIQKSYPEAKILHNRINTYAAGNNVGIRNASGKYILVLNNDTELDENFIHELTQAAKSTPNDVGMWAVKILNFFERGTIDNTGLLLYPDGLSRGRGRLERDAGQYDAVEEVCFPSGCAGMYKKQMLDEIGLFDEDFKFFVEDSDLGFRGRLAGWKCIYVPSARVYHMFSKSFGTYSPEKAFYVERNRLWFVFKLCPWKVILISPFYSFKRYLFQLYGLIIGRGAAKKFSQQYSSYMLGLILLKAWLSGISGIPAVLRKRGKITKRVSNREISSWFRKYRISAREIALKEY
ncbi:MAG: hypothetical protein A2898_02865 [Candidatus Kerfeldbacteria bacterium RIFCSPLOWO2_01_FULL_48_11]|uniref:Glycosyltransferase 2-like domain-containing protein n=1 Tax=Candidatus Kerfeldbacteria bacterium RIFCSPLOWO2_01_FULL_48_11 TaxID=1798543 RepID=A0A1G2B7B5_9BACT|nr:MAG: hypothetical protein A2898_02865 [Candidatus Kerfeldbacteria bacterium RIFCSPLOWO2_01_FULL_48_11]